MAARIESIQGMIDATEFGTIISHIDDPTSEIDYAILVLEGDLAETVLIALNGNAQQWEAMMKSGTIKIIHKKGAEVRPEAVQYMYDGEAISHKEYIDCLYVPPGYFIKRRIRTTTI